MSDEYAPPEAVGNESKALDCCPDDVRKYFIENHDKWTIEQMRSICSYLNDKIYKFTQGLESNITIEDFEKAKKIDVDNDGEEGENHGL